MIYIAAITFLAISHLIYRRGKSGNDVPLRLEKAVIFVAAISSFGAIVELLGSFVAARFIREGDDLSGWLPSIFVYPVALILFLVVVFFVLPNPIPRKKIVEQDDGDQTPGAVKLK